METKSSISISTSTFIRALLVVAVAYAVWLLHGLVLLVLTSVVIASAIEPGVAGLAKRRIPRAAGVLLMYLTVFGGLFVIVYFFLPPILGDAQGLLSSIPQYVDTLNLPINSLPSLNSLTGAVGHDSSASLLTSVFNIRNALSDSSQGAIRFITTFFGGLFSFGLVVVLSFYFALQETGVENFLRLVVPPANEEYVVSLWHRAQRKIGLWMQGQIISSVIGGVIAYLGLVILGVPYAFLLAIMTAIAMLVPIFGSFVAALPSVIVAFSAGGVSLMLIVAGLYLIINQFEANLIHPLVVNKVVGIPPLLVILALIVGGELAGFLGVLLAIPVAAAFREFLHDYDKGKRSAKSLVP
jgi:predicted PurR-regulated permease PerM